MLRACALVASLALAGCVAHAPASPTLGGTPATKSTALDYASPAAWVCRGDLPTDACRQDMDAIELHPDGSSTAAPFIPAARPDVDCFYVYPTVDLTMTPGTHTDFTDTTKMQAVTRAQAARFGQVCRVFAPLYRQATFGTFLSRDPDQHLPPLSLAYEDVQAAFDAYLQRYNGGRRIVLMGHSQGGAMIVRLLHERFDTDPAMRARLVVALPIGWDFVVDEMPNVPVCTRDNQLACVVTFKSFATGKKPRSFGPTAIGHVNACVNPADVPGNSLRTLAQAVFPTRDFYAGLSLGPQFGEAPFLLVDDAYSVRCEEGIDGFRYLAVHASGPTPLPLTTAFWRGPLGLHLLDMQLAQGDLVEIVRRRLAPH